MTTIELTNQEAASVVAALFSTGGEIESVNAKLSQQLMDIARKIRDAEWTPDL